MKHVKSSHDLEFFVALMKQANLRVTEPRKAILGVLLDKHGPFTVEELHKRVSKMGCDQATVYRCAGSLEKAGLIRRCEFGDGTARYELVGRENHHHHHVICKDCKKIEILDDCELDEIDRFARRKGFAEVSHSLEFFGVCASCQ